MCSPALLRLLGLVGYSAYLWHLPIVTLFSHFSDFTALSPAQRFPLMLGRVSIAVLLMSIFFFLAVEKPFLLIGRRRRQVLSG